MKCRLFLLSSSLLLTLSNCLFAQEDLSVYNYWKYEQGSTGQLLYKRISTQAFSYLDARRNMVAKLSTKADWQKRQQDVRAKLAKSIGPFPEKTPLNPVITGTLKRDDFTVEKLYFESRPGYHVSAAMFIPDKRQPKTPAIVFCSGHSENGFRSDAYQHLILNYVKKGFIVLAFDPIGQGERIQYQPNELKKGATNEHSYPGAQSFVSGITPANYFIWDGIRSVDYLLTRKEVDPARIGIAGRSGGGTQSAYIAAMDDRILAAAPECYITTFDKLIRSNGPQDAEQNLMNGIKNGLDIADFLQVRAPKPALIVATTMDIFSIQGARDTYHETKKAYKAYGKEDDMQMTEDDAGHASTLKNREASYAFFQKYLSNPGSPKDLEVEKFKDAELYASPNGNIISELKGQNLFSLTEKYSQGLIAQREKTRKSSPGFDKNLIQNVIRISGYSKPKENADVVFSGRMHRPDYAIEKYLVQGNGGYYIPVLWVKPKNAKGKTVLFLNETGKTQALGKDQLADKLAKEGYEVVLPDLSGIGELGNGFLKGGDSVIEDSPLNLWFGGILIDKSLVAIRAEEVGTLADFIKRNKTPNSQLMGFASGTLTSDLLHAASIENPFAKLVMINPLISYQSIVEERLYKPKYILSAVPGALPVYDLPDMVKGLSSGGLLLINPVKATGAELGKDQSDKFYPKASTTFQVQSGVKDNDLLESVLKWTN